MLIILESRVLHLLDPTMEQLKKDFLKCNPEGIVSESPNLTGKRIKNPMLVALKEPYSLVDCLSHTKESKEFLFQVIEYLHQENHHIAISTVEIRNMNARLRRLATHRILIRPTKLRIFSLTQGRAKAAIPGKDNLWEIITTPPEILPEGNLEPDTDLENKVLVTIVSQSGQREDYLVKPEEPFTLGDGRILTIVLPDTSNIIT